MAKIRVCDVCRQDGTLTETTRYQRLKGCPELNVDVCETHRETIPKKTLDYIRFALKVTGMYDADDEMIRRMYGSKIRL